MNRGENTEPVFRTIGQCLFLAYAMEVTPPSTRSPTETLIRDLMKQRYGEAPVPVGERSINMGGMSPMELRAQCALIRAAVNDHTAGQERDTICARFGHQVTRANAVRGLRDQYRSLCNTQVDEAVLALIWAIYAPGVRQFPGEGAQAFNMRRKKRADEWSTRGIEKNYSVGRSVLRRDQDMLRKLLHGVEMQAQAKLEELFIRTGLVGDSA
jgi:hypothetical protein